MKKNRALFLDRDGVINIETGNYIAEINNFILNDAIIPIVKKAKEKGYFIIVITNQGGIAKRLYTHELLHEIHVTMLNYFLKHDIVFDEIYYCPHHPDVSGKCYCRKPGSLMIEKAAARFDIDLEKSFFIGDHERDMEAATAAGVKGIYIPSNDLSSLENISL